ncbi:MAG TPA: hypothetical protein HA348_02005 [Thermoplasmata archaeon]|nr:hypothetical protein [Thermoplasmata archaeon]
MSVKTRLSPEEKLRIFTESLKDNVKIAEICRREEIIKQMHKILVKDVRGGTLEPRRYRKVQNYVVNSLTREIIYSPAGPIKIG